MHLFNSKDQAGFARVCKYLAIAAAMPPAQQHYCIYHTGVDLVVMVAIFVSETRRVHINRGSESVRKHIISQTVLSHSKRK